MNRDNENFVIVSVPRSGTNYLCSLLNSHPDIVCHLEVFHKDAIYYAIGRGKDMEVQSIKVRDNNPIWFLSNLWKKTFDKKIVGFKLFIGHNTEILNHVLADKKVKKLLLIRQNVVRLYVSTQIAAMTGEYCKLVNQNAESKRPSCIYFDIQAFLSFAHQIEGFYSKCEATMIETGQKFFKIYYPDILNHSTQNKILEFLDVRLDVDGMHSKFMQQGDYQLKDIISNYEEVSRSLVNTKYFRDLE